MGLFSFVGKLAKAAVGVAKVVGIPGSGAGSAALNALLGAKKPMGNITGAMAIKLGPQLVRGNSTQSMGGAMTMSARELRATPVMPGGAIATRSGMAAPSSSAPPRQFGGAGGKKRRTAKKATTRKRTTKRKTGTRKLKFGSPAWRAKYMKRKK